MINRLIASAAFLNLQMILSVAAGIEGKTLLFKEAISVVPYPQSHYKIPR